MSAQGPLHIAVNWILGGHEPACSVIRGESWGLVWEWGSLTSVVSRAPSTSLAKSGTSALPGLRALLGTLPVVGLRDTAVLVVRVSSSIFGPVSSPELVGVVIVLSGSWDISVAEAQQLRRIS